MFNRVRAWWSYERWDFIWFALGRCHRCHERTEGRHCVNYRCQFCDLCYILERQDRTVSF